MDYELMMNGNVRIGQKAPDFEATTTFGKYRRLKEVNYKIFVDMEEHRYRKYDILMGCKEFLVQDPNGHVLRFSQDLEKIMSTKANVIKL